MLKAFSAVRGVRLSCVALAALVTVGCSSGNDGIVIVTPTPSASPSPTMLPTIPPASPTATVSPTPSGTPTATPSGTPTATPSGTPTAPPTPTPVAMVYGVRNGNELVRFSPSTPGTVQSLGGFPLAGDSIIGLDRRPSDNNLYAVSASGRVFQVTLSGASNSPFLQEIQPIFLNDAAAPPLPDATRRNFDFNPAADALRIIGDDGTNLRVPTAALTNPAPAPAVNTLVDGRMGYAQGVTAAAYTNNNPSVGNVGTELFVIDTVNDVLYEQAANQGELSFVATLKDGDNGGAPFDLDAVNGYDIFQASNGDNEHYVVASPAGMGAALLYSLVPSTGTLTQIAAVLSNGMEIANNAGGLVVFELDPESPTGQTRTAFILDTSGAADVIRQHDFFTDGVGNPAGRRNFAINGLQPGERLVGIDARTTPQTTIPQNVAGTPGTFDTLYGVTTANRVVALPITDFAANGTMTVAEAATLSTSLQGGTFGVDFNPPADLLRIVSDTGQNLRVNLQLGREIEGQARNPGFAFVDRSTRVVLNADGDGPEIAATAYRAAPVNGTFQFALDARDSSLARVVVPNDGALQRVGSLGVNIAALEQSFDIAGANDSLALASLRVNAANRSALYSINLTTGMASLIGSIGAAGSAPVDVITVRFE